MPAIIKHPDVDQALEQGNNGFFPAIKIVDLRKQYGIDTKTDDDELIMMLQSVLMDINNELSAWVCRQTEQEYFALEDVPADTLPDQSQSDPIKQVSVLVLSYHRAVGNAVKAAVIRSQLNFDLTKTGEGEAKEKEDHAMHYSAESKRAVRRILGRSHIRVRRIKTKSKNKNWPVDTLRHSDEWSG